MEEPIQPYLIFNIETFNIETFNIEGFLKHQPLPHNMLRRACVFAVTYVVTKKYKECTCIRYGPFDNRRGGLGVLV